MHRRLPPSLISRAKAFSDELRRFCGTNLVDCLALSPQIVTDMVELLLAMRKPCRLLAFLSLAYSKPK